MSDLQFRQSLTGVMDRLSQYGESQKQLEETRDTYRFDVEKLKDEAEASALGQISSAGNIATSTGLEVHTLISSARNSKLVKTLLKAKDKVSKLAEEKKGAKEEEPKTEEEEPSDIQMDEIPELEEEGDRYTSLEYGAEPSATESTTIARVGDIAKDPNLFDEFLSRYDTTDRIGQISSKYDVPKENVVDKIRGKLANDEKVLKLDPDSQFAVSREPIPQEPRERARGVGEETEPVGEKGVGETSFGETPTQEISYGSTAETDTASLLEKEGVKGLSSLGEEGSSIFSGLGDAIGEGLGAVGDALATGLSATADALGPIGVLAGLGFGIYDDIMEQKQEKQEQAQSVKLQGDLNNLANKPEFSLGSRALPTLDTSQFRGGGAMLNF